MILVRRWWPARVVVAASGFAAAVALTIWAGWRAWTLEPLPPASRDVTSDPVSELRPQAPTPPARLRAAIAANPFRSDREPAPVAFQLPGAAPVKSEGVPEVQLVLVGTAVLPEGRSFAMCRLGGDPPKVVHVGEQVGTFVLKSVDQGRAIFQAAHGGTLEVRVQKAGS